MDKFTLTFILLAKIFEVIMFDRVLCRQHIELHRTKLL